MATKKKRQQDQPDEGTVEIAGAIDTRRVKVPPAKAILMTPDGNQFRTRITSFSVDESTGLGKLTAVIKGKKTKKKSSPAAQLGRKGGQKRWEGMSAKQRREEMKRIASMPRPSRRKKTEGKD